MAILCPVSKISFPDSFPLIRPGPDSSAPKSFAALGDTLIFTADDGLHGPELWTSDGTAEGTVPVKDVNTATRGAEIGDRVAMDGIQYFNAQDASHGAELWRSDGTAAGTWMVMDIVPGRDSSWARPMAEVG